MCLRSILCLDVWAVLEIRTMNEWRNWGGSEENNPPVSWSTLVEIEFRDGYTDNGYAYQWCWKNLGEARDILRYRVIAT